MTNNCRIKLRLGIIGLVFILSINCIGQVPNSTNKEFPTSSKLLLGDTVRQVDGEIRGIYQDSKNNLWFASNGNGVYKYNGDVIVNFTEKHGLSSNYVWMVTEGKNGTLWFKTNLLPQDVNVLCNFNGIAFKTIQTETLAKKYDFQNNELLFDYYYDGKSLSKIKFPQNSPIQNDLNIKHHYDIYSSLKDSKGNVWFGTATAGICKYNGTSYEWFGNSELGAAIRCIFEDKNRTIWAGNNGDGVFRFDGKNFTHFSRENNLHNTDFEKYPIGKPGLLSRVWSITEDNEGRLWFGTIDNGVWLYDGKTFTNYTTQDGLAIDAIWCIYKDKNGKLWFGTEGAGVYTFNGKTFEKFKN
jgi:ligand-binding sensor domain-containing protein